MKYIVLVMDSNYEQALYVNKELATSRGEATVYGMDVIDCTEPTENVRLSKLFLDFAHEEWPDNLDICERSPDENIIPFRKKL